MKTLAYVRGGLLLAGVFALILPAMAADAPQAAPAGAGQANAPAVFAVVDGVAIDVPTYEAEMTLLIREKYYHRRPPEEQMRTVRREIGDRLIEQVLLLAEAKRRGLTPDSGKVTSNLAAIDARNRSNPLWKQRREDLLPQIRQELEQSSLVERLEEAVRVAPQPSEDELRTYHAQHKDKFTEPDRLRLSTILLGVGPGAPQAEWDQAKAQAQALREQLLAGADFAALARKLSKDDSAQKGGDMGYVHRGMLSDELHAEIDKLKQGELSGPLQMLEGIALFRVDERIVAQPKSFDESRARALQLWQRERGERQWAKLKAALRKAAVIEIRDPSRYPPLEKVKP